MTKINYKSLVLGGASTLFLSACAATSDSQMNVERDKAFLETFQSFSSCDDSFFHSLKQYQKQWASVAPIEEVHDISYIKVPSRDLVEGRTIELNGGMVRPEASRHSLW